MTKTASRKAIPPPPKPASASLVSAPSKLDRLVELMRRPQGATLVQMQEATGWLAHSVRGALSGSLKARLSLPITSTKTNGVRVYRIASEAAR